MVEDHLKDLSSYTILDVCAGAGGPTPVLESEINKKLESEGKKSIQFVFSDLFPHREEWSRISKKQQNVTYIETPVDARAAPRVAAKGKKECRIFNICFHHFGDRDAAGILRNTIESADAFM